MILINFSDDHQPAVHADGRRDTAVQQPGSVASVLRRAVVRPDAADRHGVRLVHDPAPRRALRLPRRTGPARRGPRRHLPHGLQHVMYIFPTLDACGWAGLGDIAGPETWINGYVQLRVMGHELGHNFGVHHANSWECTVSRRARLAERRRELRPRSTATRSASWARARPGSSRPSTRTSSAGSSRPDLTVTASGTYTIAADELETAATQHAADPAHRQRAVHRRPAAVRHVLRQLPARIRPGQRRTRAARARRTTSAAAVADRRDADTATASPTRRSRPATRSPIPISGAIDHRPTRSPPAARS